MPVFIWVFGICFSFGAFLFIVIEDKGRRISNNGLQTGKGTTENFMDIDGRFGGTKKTGGNSRNVARETD